MISISTKIAVDRLADVVLYLNKLCRRTCSPSSVKFKRLEDFVFTGPINVFKHNAAELCNYISVNLERIIYQGITVNDL